MAEKKVTTMVIKFDLECEKCQKKIKKVLCRIPQIQNQIYDKKAGTVTITVVCCSPEKIKEKIIYKGGEAVKSIEIKVPEKPKVEEKKPKEEKKEEAKKEEPKGAVDGDGKPIGTSKPKALIVEPSKPNEPEKTKALIVHPRTYCADCYRGISGGPCFHDYGRPAPPCYEAYGRPVYDSWSGGGGGCGCQRSGYYVCRCEYVCEDNPSSCSIM
uniref:HMA domain-containing protein n=1 Tax=Populus davidiana TaxID=266767 RepID=A0A6M2E9B3_9ROSI